RSASVPCDVIAHIAPCRVHAPNSCRWTSTSATVAAPPWSATSRSGGTMGPRRRSRRTAVDSVVPEKLGRAPVMADVAARAGVSHQTVSRVLNSPDLVRPATRERVEEAIASLGYRRNMSARALATSRTQLIGVVTPAMTLFGPSHMALAIQEAARSV